MNFEAGPSCFSRSSQLSSFMSLRKITYHVFHWVLCIDLNFFPRIPEGKYQEDQKASFIRNVSWIVPIIYLEIFCYQLYQVSQSLYFNVTLKFYCVFCTSPLLVPKSSPFLDLFSILLGIPLQVIFSKKVFPILSEYFDPYLNIQILVRLGTVLCSK